MSAASLQKSVVAFGELFWRHLPAGTWLGGAPFQMAYRLKPFDEAVHLVTRLGKDKSGDQAWEHLESAGISTDYVQRDAMLATGNAQVSIDSKGYCMETIVPQAAFDAIEWNDALNKLAARCDCVYFDTLIQRAQGSRATLRNVLDHARKAVRFLDLKIYRDIQESFDQETVTYSMEQATVVKMNLDAAHYLAELFEIPNPSLPDFCTELIDEWGLDCCVVTLGRYGLFGAGKNGRRIYCPGYEVATPMPGEGGSASAAGFIHQYVRRHSLAECCRWGNLLGAMAVAHSDPMQPITPQFVHAFRDRNQPGVVEPELQAYQ